jgi:outer membrane protein OmpA-like peptidoglycan-associated protein
MAFDLEKGGGSANKPSSSSSAGSVFDLTKSEKKGSVFDLKKSDDSPASRKAGDHTDLPKNKDIDSSKRSTQTQDGDRNSSSKLILGFIFLLLLGAGGYWLIGSDSQPISQSPSETSKIENSGLSDPINENLPAEKIKTTQLDDSSATLKPSSVEASDSSSMDNSVSAELSSRVESGDEQGVNNSSNLSEPVSDVTSLETGKSSSDPLKDSFLDQGSQKKVVATFLRNSPELSESSNSSVEQLVEFMKANAGSRIVVEGYASSEGDLSFNEKISRDRANSLRNRLISLGIDGKRIDAVGRGIADPIASNDTEDGRMKNRRVEVSFE